MLADDGSLYTENLRTARQTDEFTLGGGPAVLEPRFTLHGFRYAEISGYPGDLGPADIVARVVHSDIPAAGLVRVLRAVAGPAVPQYRLGSARATSSACRPTARSATSGSAGWATPRSSPAPPATTATSRRSSPSGWTTWPTPSCPSGAFTDIAPRLNLRGAGAPAWGDAGVIVPWTVWKMYGDRGSCDRHFGAMTAWMDFLERANPDYLRARELGNSYNDWLAPGDDDTPHELLATAYWAYDAALMAEIADAVGRPDDAAGYRALRSKIRSAFADAFVADDGQIASGTQTAYVLGLHMDLIPDELRAAAADHLVAAIRHADWHLTTGFVGVGYLLPVLSSTGHPTSPTGCSRSRRRRPGGTWSTRARPRSGSDGTAGPKNAASSPPG